LTTVAGMGAAQSGTVRSVNCKPGELVQPGVQLVEIEE
jgi:biotin carboxyl carrier protein